MVWSAVNAINTTLLHTVHQTSLLGVACYIYIYIYIFKLHVMYINFFEKKVTLLQVVINFLLSEKNLK